MPILMLLLVVAAAAAPLSAQQPLTESIEVRVVNVDVVVTDRAGNIITGLTKDDFEIFEDQKPQTITNFYEVRGGQAESSDPDVEAAPAPPRRFIFFFDNDSLHPANRKRVAAAVDEFIGSQMQPNDLASVTVWNRTLKVIAPFTSDRKILRQALQRLPAEGTTGGIRSELARVQKQCVQSLDTAKSGGIPYEVAYADCTNVARGETHATAMYSRQLLNALELAMTTFAGATGKKILVLTGALLPRDPGVEIFHWANALFTPYMRGFDAPLQRPDQEEKQLDFLEKAADTANAHGVTIYGIAATISTDTTRADYKYAVNDGGADFMNQANTFAAYEVLAQRTGGVSINRPSDFNAALGQIARELQSYYSIGYRPSDTISGRSRAVTVRTKRRDLVVRSKQTHSFKTADDLMSDRVIANIFIPDESERDVTITTDTPRQNGPHFTVPFEISMPADLTLLPNGPAMTGGFTVFVAVGNAQGALSTVFRHPQPVTIRAAEEAAFRKEPLTFGATLTLRPGENILSVAVVDQVSGETAFGRTTINAR